MAPRLATHEKLQFRTERERNRHTGLSIARGEFISVSGRTWKEVNNRLDTSGPRFIYRIRKDAAQGEIPQLNKWDFHNLKRRVYRGERVTAEEELAIIVHNLEKEVTEYHVVAR